MAHTLQAVTVDGEDLGPMEFARSGRLLLTNTVPLFLRRYWASLLCFALAAAIGLAAIADRSNKQSRIDKAEVLEWYCAHDGTRCGGPSSERIETHWNERQLAYEIVVSGLGGFAILLFVGRTLRR